MGNRNKSNKNETNLLNREAQKKRDNYRRGIQK